MIGRFLLFILVAVAAWADGPRDLIRWSELPAIPGGAGCSGGYAGVSNGALLVAGGTSFSNAATGHGETKIGHDVFVMETPSASWRLAGTLPRPSGNGLALTVSGDVLLIGGGNGRENFTTVLRARWTGRQVVFESLPVLPRPLAMAAGAVVGRRVYIAGGVTQPEAIKAEKGFYSLDLDHLDTGWSELEPWPGPERFLAAGAAQDGAFFLFGGATRGVDREGKPQSEWLRDAYRYTPVVGWRRIADLPGTLAAMQSPAPNAGPAHLLFFGGDSGSPAGSEPAVSHSQSPRDLWAYHPLTDTWAKMGKMPFLQGSAPVVPWLGKLLVPGGNAVWTAELVRAPRSFGWFNYLTLTIYLLLVAGVGLWFMRRQKSTSDYFKGGGRVPWWAAGLSIFATMLSSITFMAIPAKAYATDWVFAVGNLAALALAPVVIAFYLPFFRQLNVTSAYEYLERRFNLAVRLYASASFILFQTGRMAVVIYLPALALSAAAGFDVQVCVLLIGVTCAIYTAVGGIEAVIWTDAVQAVVLLGAAILSLVLIAGRLDGTPAEWWVEAHHYGKLHLVNWSWDLTTASVFVIVIGSLLSNLAPYTADQAVVQRYITTNNEVQARRAIWMNAWLSVPATLLFFAIGTALFLFYRQNPSALEPSLGADSIFPLFISDFMPAGVAGIVIAGIFAAAQSTASSSVNSVVTALITDWLRRFRPDISDHVCLRLSQWLSVALGLGGTGAALYLAGANVRSLWDTYLGLLGLLGSGLAGLFALGIFSRRANGAGALIGALTGAAALAWVQRTTSLHFLLYGAVGTVTCFGVGWLASLCFPSNKKDLTGLTWRTLVRDA